MDKLHTQILTINHLIYFVSFDALHFSVISRHFPNTYTEPLDSYILKMYKKKVKFELSSNKMCNLGLQ